MSVLTEINGYYRIIISAINSRNSPATNHYLIRELIEANTKLAQSAINLICSERITKISLTLDSPSTPFFYAIQSKNLSRQYLVMPGYCDCHYFAECVLSRCTAFTCVHEMACILLEYMDSTLSLGAEAIVKFTEEVEETEYLEQMLLLHDE